MPGARRKYAAICQIPGCGIAHHARGLCSTHYGRWRGGRDAKSPVRHPLVGSPAERLLAGIEYDTNGGCWLWKYASHNHGYGVLSVDRRLRKAHRLAYEVWVGPIPAGLVVCHKCDTPACVNPAHLFVGTQADNLADMAAKGRWNPAATRRGSANGCARLTEADIGLIRAASRAGESFTSIGTRFGVSRVTIAKIAKGQGWRHVLEGEAA
jgi:hypothetical protein